MNGDVDRTLRSRRAKLFFWAAPLLFPLTYFALKALPTADLCRFRDNHYLLALWPGNFQIYDQIMAGPLSNSDGCFILAVRSVYSCYFAALAAFVIYISVWRVRSPSAKVSVSKATLSLIFFGAGAMFFSAFDDHAHGRYDELALHTYNTVPILVLKSFVPMVAFYVCLYAWIVAARSSFGMKGNGIKQESVLKTLDGANSVLGSNRGVDYSSGQDIRHGPRND
ncbi:hypothetical protein [Rhizobium tubonense]|uniref:Uncharacterized protein n=1 Tax=Rhizobium tubonense TaxID=484088 RepID=A0A2W4C8V1_9HYPH|nr:hypothetical protein [Rhizobium tubonense]PZM07565.1 hypothetical protein CPY51_31025 [Rhizobium tubonense]